MIFDRLRALAGVASDLGLAKKTLTLPSPSIALLPSPDRGELTDDLVFERMITEPEIYDVSRDLFVGQFYSNSVQEAFSALDNFIKSKVGVSSPSGAQLMRQVFNPKSPRLVLNAKSNQSEIDEDEGYGHIFAGSMQGIRNPVSHEFQWIEDRDTALECLVLCQHLIRKAKSASPPTNGS